MIVITQYENKNICKVNQKIYKYTSGKLEERKPQKIGDSSNNDRVAPGNLL